MRNGSGPSQDLLILIKARLLNITNKEQEEGDLYSKGLNIVRLSETAYLSAHVVIMIGGCYYLHGSDYKEISTYGLYLDLKHLPKSPKVRYYFSHFKVFFNIVDHYDSEEKSLIKRFITLYSAEFPKSLDLVLFVAERVRTCIDKNKLGTASKYAVYTDELFTARSCDSLEYAEFLPDYRIFTENIKMYQKSFEICKNHLPQYGTLSICLGMFETMWGYEAVEPSFLEVYNIYSNSYPEADQFPTLLLELGNFYEKNNQYELAEEKYIEAYSTSAKINSKSHIMILCIGRLISSCREMMQKGNEEMGRMGAKEVYCIKGCQVHEARVNIYSAANFLDRLRKLYKD